MEINVSHEQGREPVTVFHIDGRINLGNADQLQAKAQEAYQNGMRNLILDLSQVESITSVGLRAILAIHKMLNPIDPQSADSRTGKSTHLKLLGPTPQVHKVLTTAGFTDFLEVYEDQQDAVASF